MEIVELGKLIGDLSAPAMLALLIVALVKRWLILPRELDEARTRVEELKGERNEFKGLLYRALNIGERAASFAEDRDKYEQR